MWGAQGGAGHCSGSGQGGCCRWAGFVPLDKDPYGEQRPRGVSQPPKVAHLLSPWALFPALVRLNVTDDRSLVARAGPNTIDWEALCIIPQKQCWVLYVDAMVVESGVQSCCRGVGPTSQGTGQSTNSQRCRSQGMLGAWCVGRFPPLGTHHPTHLGP